MKDQSLPLRCCHLSLLGVFAAGLLLGQTAAAQPYPTKPVTLIVAAAAGGSSDLTGRALADGLQRHWKQPVIVENKPGANGFVAAQALSKSQADGYTLMLGSIGQMMLNPIQHGPEWQPNTAYSLIGQVSKTYMVMVTAPAAPYSDLKEYLDYARSNKGKVSYSSSGVGSLMHIAGAVINQEAGADLAHIPYRGEAPALVDLMSGTVSAGFVVAGTALPLVQGGKLKALAVSDGERAPALPDVRTASEYGFDVVMPVWNGVVGPAGMSKDLIRQINDDVNEVLKSDAFREAMTRIDITPSPTSSQAFSDFVADQSDRWKQAITATGIELR